MLRIKTYDEIADFDRDEIFKYMLCRKADDRVKALTEDCIAEISGKLSYRVCYDEIEIKECGDVWNLGFTKTSSLLVNNRLSGCCKIVLFAATIGLETDRLIKRYAMLSPSKALAFQAIGAERIEALCDKFEAEIIKSAAEHGFDTCERFSPGYGDFDIAEQKNIFAYLAPEKAIGLMLNESLMMSPSKSVTALIGIKTRGE